MPLARMQPPRRVLGGDSDAGGAGTPVEQPTDTAEAAGTPDLVSTRSNNTSSGKVVMEIAKKQKLKLREEQRRLALEAEGEGNAFLPPTPTRTRAPEPSPKPSPSSGLGAVPYAAASTPTVAPAAAAPPLFLPQFCIPLAARFAARKLAAAHRAANAVSSNDAESTSLEHASSEKYRGANASPSTLAGMGPLPPVGGTGAADRSFTLMMQAAGTAEGARHKPCFECFRTIVRADQSRAEFRDWHEQCNQYQRQLWLRGRSQKVTSCLLKTQTMAQRHTTMSRQQRDGPWSHTSLTEY
jgi:hypothetical protein